MREFTTELLYLRSVGARNYYLHLRRPVSVSNRPRKNVVRDFGLALDFYSRRGEKGLAKALAKKWNMKDPQHVYRIVNRQNSEVRQFVNVKRKLPKDWDWPSILLAVIERSHQEAEVQGLV